MSAQIVAVAKTTARKGNKFMGSGINICMEKQKENQKFKIYCIKAPKWLSYFLRKFVKDRG